MLPVFLDSFQPTIQPVFFLPVFHSVFLFFYFALGLSFIRSFFQVYCQIYSFCISCFILCLYLSPASFPPANLLISFIHHSLLSSLFIPFFFYFCFSHFSFHCSFSRARHLFLLAYCHLSFILSSLLILSSRTHDFELRWCINDILQWA